MHKQLLNAILANSTRINYKIDCSEPQLFYIETNDDVIFKVWAQSSVPPEGEIEYTILHWELMLEDGTQ